MVESRPGLVICEPILIPRASYKGSISIVHVSVIKYDETINFYNVVITSLCVDPSQNL